MRKRPPVDEGEAETPNEQERLRIHPHLLHQLQHRAAQHQHRVSNMASSELLSEDECPQVAQVSSEERVKVRQQSLREMFDKDMDHIPSLLATTTTDPTSVVLDTTQDGLMPCARMMTKCQARSQGTTCVPESQELPLGVELPECGGDVDNYLCCVQLGC